MEVIKKIWTEIFRKFLSKMKNLKIWNFEVGVIFESKSFDFFSDFFSTFHYIFNWFLRWNCSDFFSRLFWKNIFSKKSIGHNFKGNASISKNLYQEKAETQLFRLGTFLRCFEGVFFFHQKWVYNSGPPLKGDSQEGPFFLKLKKNNTLFDTPTSLSRREINFIRIPWYLIYIISRSLRIRAATKKIPSKDREVWLMEIFSFFCWKILYFSMDFVVSSMVFAVSQIN